MYFLALHSDVMRKLRSEILQAYGTTGRPSIEDMKDLKHRMYQYILGANTSLTCVFQVRAVISETMRLFPPVPLNIRQSDQNAHVFPACEEVPNYFIPPNTVILYTILLID